VAISKILLASKSAHVFCSKSFASNWLRSLKSASRFLVKVLASKWFHFAKSVFFWLAFSLVKSGFQNWLQGFSKSIGKFGSGFSARFIFSGKVNSSQSQFFSMGFSKSSALAFW